MASGYGKDQLTKSYDHAILALFNLLRSANRNREIKDPGQPADSYYQVRPECTDVPKTRFKIKAGKTLSTRKWQAAFTPEGYLDISKTLRRIYRGGIHPSIRGEVWEFLLGCYDPKSTFDERDQIRQRRRIQYGRWKEECRQIFPVVGSGEFITAPVITEEGQPIQEPLVILETNQDRGPSQDGNFADANGSNQSRTNISSSEMVRDLTSRGPLDQKVIQWLLTLHQIGLDVHRTDRTLVFYEKKENLSKLWDILAVYAWIDTDVGYCQASDVVGMSDLCSPMIMLLEDEADAFWCFERLMRRLRGNFRCTESSVGVETQLSNLAEITQVIDPKLHQHLVPSSAPSSLGGVIDLMHNILDALGGGDYLFAFRMLMVLFRREFSFCDSLYLWEKTCSKLIMVHHQAVEFIHNFRTKDSEGQILGPPKYLLSQMMWALEYDPDLFSIYEDPELNFDKAEGSKGRAKSIRHYGKFERENMKNGAANSESPLPISIFLVASVLKDKSSKLLQEARGLDDVVKILNDMTGNLDAKKACTGAMKLHKKYLKKNSFGTWKRNVNSLSDCFGDFKVSFMDQTGTTHGEAGTHLIKRQSVEYGILKMRNTSMHFEERQVFPSFEGKEVVSFFEVQLLTERVETSIVILNDEAFIPASEPSVQTRETLYVIR
ncbi:unnamed protein product [Dovyalis caffra]|uniref:Rab-GAP TBC domain-containing protein n=1 Tax=Dovyalis caffra TaxID=77055 RepID=A0AAV1RSB2_9ROSI|nr:unnamed protein product [Dovyalis caffra]